MFMNPALSQSVGGIIAQRDPYRSTQQTFGKPVQPQPGQNNNGWVGQISNPWATIGKPVQPSPGQNNNPSVGNIIAQPSPIQNAGPWNMGNNQNNMWAGGSPNFNEFTGQYRQPQFQPSIGMPNQQPMMQPQVQPTGYDAQTALSQQIATNRVNPQSVGGLMAATFRF